MRVGGKAIDIVALTLRLAGELLDQLWHQIDHLANQGLHRVACLNTAIQDAVEQIFDGPTQLPDDQGPDHTPAALEGMEGAPYFRQRLLVVGIGHPARQVFGDGLQHFADFLDEHFEQFFVDRLFICRRW